MGEEVDDDTGQGTDQRVTDPAQVDVLGHRVICDGLLCSILNAMSYAANKDEFISVIERDCDEEEILSSRRKLFTFYSAIQCDKQRKPILQITRGSVRKNIEDIVEQMIKIDEQEKSELFYMPWNYEIKPFKSDTEVRSELIEKELNTDMDAKIDSLKNEMNIKNQAMMELINSKFNEVLKRVSAEVAVKQPTFASVAAGQGVQAGVGQGQVPTINFPENTRHARDAHVRGRGVDRHQGAEGGEDRDRSASKRRRVEEQTTGENQSRARSQSQTWQKKFVVGTSNQSGRKMRSPPADIFVYGVHPDTSKEDIVQDLAFHNIIIDANDIIQKSKEEAFLKSYKISVKAEDLEMALDPGVWPLRVKVREFIHYSRRPNSQRAGGGSNGQGVQHGLRHHSQGGDIPAQGVGRGAQYGHGQDQDGWESRGSSPSFLAPNRYALPGQGIPGGPVESV